MRVSITLSIIKTIVSIAYLLLDPVTALFVDQAIHFGFFLGLRPGDYADLHSPQNGHRMLSYQIYFLFDLKKDPISLADRHLFPKLALPLMIIAMPDNSKACQLGGTPMRGLACNPDTSPGSFCGCLNFFHFITADAYYPAKGQRVFSRFPPGRHSLHAAITLCIKAAASQLCLPPHLMHLVGVRPGIVEHLAEFSNADQDHAGGWNSNRYRKEAGGRAPYLRPTIGWALRVTAALHSLEHSNISRWVTTAQAGPARDPITRPHTLELATTNRHPLFNAPPRHKTIA